MPLSKAEQAHQRSIEEAKDLLRKWVDYAWFAETKPDKPPYGFVGCTSGRPEEKLFRQPMYQPSVLGTGGRPGLLTADALIIKASGEKQYAGLYYNYSEGADEAEHCGYFTYYPSDDKMTVHISASFDLFDKVMQDIATLHPLLPACMATKPLDIIADPDPFFDEITSRFDREYIMKGSTLSFGPAS